MKSMRINEQWAQLRKELNDAYTGITLGEYASSKGSVTRGPHVALMIPADKEENCPHCNHKLDKVRIPEPSRGDVEKLLDIVSTYLCDVIWSGEIKTEHHAGGMYTGTYYKIVFDKPEQQ